MLEATLQLAQFVMRGILALQTLGIIGTVLILLIYLLWQGIIYQRMSDSIVGHFKDFPPDPTNQNIW